MGMIHDYYIGIEDFYEHLASITPDTIRDDTWKEWVREFCDGGACVSPRGILFSDYGDCMAFILKFGGMYVQR